MGDDQPIVDKEGNASGETEVAGALSADAADRISAELQESTDKYLRLYADFENYKKRVSKDKEDLIKYANENLMQELLPAVDHLEMALRHVSDKVNTGLAQGVEITLKELKKTLQKFGLTEIEAEGRSFDPMVHHAMAQVERDDIDENMVVEEYRKGYMLKDKVIRAALVAVSKKPVKEEKSERAELQINMKEEES